MNLIIPKGFFGYPSSPATSGECIRNAVSEINNGSSVSLKIWEELSVSGNIIIRKILDEIDDSDIFCADLTGLNPNVMFEFGYAIAKNKKIWVVLDNSITAHKKLFKDFRILSTIGYCEFTNSLQIIEGFYSDFKTITEGTTLFEQLIGSSVRNSEKESLLYLKNRLNTESSVQLTRRISDTPLPFTMDDPQEVEPQYLPWYASKIYSSIGIVCHLMNPEQEGATLHNAKYSMVSGMALGMDKNLLMLAQGDFHSPMDYRDILRHYESAKKSVVFLDDWLKPIEAEWIDRESSRQSYVATLKLAQELQEVQVGEPIAENESDKLINYYFVRTAAFREALDGNQTVFVGRKGTGKSANFIKIANDLQVDKRNLVVKIKPIDYELQSLAELLLRYAEPGKKTYAIENLWKFLLISEIANVLFTEIRSRPGAEATVNDDEAELVRIMERDEGMMTLDFTVRLERCVKSLLAIPDGEKRRNIESDQNSISEALHKGIYSEVRLVLGRILSNRKRVAIIVDNLDKAWNKNDDLTDLAQFFLGLLSATRRLTRDFTREDSRRGSANVTIAVFLRSDIFHKIKSVAREPDKINSFRLRWDDPEQLSRVIEERFRALHSGNLEPDEIWERYFTKTVKGVLVKDYFLDHILPRPRDLVYFVKASIAIAVNRGHERVEEEDILEAERQYSQFAIDSLLVEGDLPSRILERIVYEFIGSPPIITFQDIEARLQDISEINDIQKVVDNMCELRFIGIEVLKDEFRFSDDPAEYKKAKILSRNFLESNNMLGARYKIHAAYHSFLEI